MIENLEILQNNMKTGGVDKFLLQEYPDLKNELIDDFKKDKIEHYQEIKALKQEISNLNELINNLEDRLKVNKIEENILNVEFQFLNFIKESVNLIVELLQKVGIDVDKVDFETLNELKRKITQLDENIKSLENEDNRLLKTLKNDENKLSNLNMEQQAINKRLEFIENSDIIDSLNKLEKKYNLTEEDKKAILKAEREIYEKLNKFNLNDLENQNLIAGLNHSLIEIKKELQKEFEDIDFSYSEIVSNGIMGASFGAVGGPLGVVTGFAGGVGGVILKDLSTHIGISENVADLLQVGVDFVSGIGIGKIILKSLPETFIKDLPLRAEYLAKGILNDLREYEFVDKSGKVIFRGKIKDILGEETITMPYIGSKGPNSTAAGYLRDAKHFGAEFMKKYPAMLSEENKARILAGKSPIVDEVWLKYHPNQKAFLGDKLEHHHVNNLGEATYVPQSLHRGKTNKDILHVDNDKIIDSIKELVKQKLGKGQA